MSQENESFSPRPLRIPLSHSEFLRKFAEKVKVNQTGDPGDFETGSFVLIFICFWDAVYTYNDFLLNFHFNDTGNKNKIVNANFRKNSK